MKKLIVCLVILLCATYAHSSEWIDGKEVFLAEGVQIEDAGSYYTDDNVEDALQEIGAGTVVTETDPIASAVNGILKSDGTTLSAASAGTDYYLLGETSSTAYRGDRGKTAYDHSQDNSQAHSDYLINNGNDTTSGTLTAGGFTDSTATLSSGILNGLTDINATATTDLTIGGTSDVANADPGKALYVYRKAAEGDGYIKFFVDEWKTAQIASDRGVYFNCLVSSGFSFRGLTQGNPYIRHDAYITAVGANRYIQYKINDTTDNYELAREDSNIAAFDIQMPLITDAITSSADIASSSLTVDTTTLVANASGYEDKVGIGTATPSAELDIDDSGGVTGTPQISFNSDRAVVGYDGSGGSGADYAFIRAGTAKDLRLQTNGISTKIMILSSGEVGIGITTVPEALTIGNAGKLQINSNGNDKNIKVEHNDTNGVITVSSGHLDIYTGGVDRRINIKDSGGIEVMRAEFNTNLDQILFALDDDGGNQLIITNSSNTLKDHDHALCTDPTWIVHSDTNPDVSNNQWGSSHHNKTNYIITSGANTGAGSAPTTVENAIVLSPRGTEAARVDTTGIVTDAIHTDAGASGILTLGGVGGSYNETMTLDFESVGDKCIVGTTTSLNGIFFNCINTRVSDDNYYMWGSYSTTSADAKMGWATQGNDSLQLGLRCNAASNTGYFSIMDYADIGNANRSPLAVSVNPVLRIYSSDATQALDYIEQSHNQTNAVMSVGNGVLDASGVGGVIFPSSDPNVAGAWWDNAGTLTRSAG